MSIQNQNDNLSKKQINDCRGQLLDWYDQHKRALPWRDVNDPYKTWLSEVMLQQTTVQAVKAYYEKFLTKWPAVQDLASATQEQVMHEWAGLGYYSRARNLHKCAQIIVANHNGKFPQDQAELIKLPGIGDYSSAAIRTIAFNKPATVVDGNIERIITRLCRITEPLPKAKRAIKTITAPLFTNHRPGDLAQALMDLGSTICTPKSPKCTSCPIHVHCAAYRVGDMETYPIKLKKKKRPSKKGYVYWITNPAGEILLERRPDKGILAETLGFPTSEWSIETPPHLAALTRVIETSASIKHVFTHFELELTLCTASITAPPPSAIWLAKDAPEIKGLPSLFMKVYKQFLLTI